MNEVPTLLVGLGGIGSRIVNDVYGMIPAERRSRIAVHIFDTNVNDISKLKNLHKDWKTQTSKDLTVEQYLNYLSDSEAYVKDWFPFEQREIRRKSLTEGAGMIRSISRLAYRAAIQEGKLDNLHRQLTSIFKEVGESEVKSARVMIISSLTGGTGAGIFLQTAMYLRDILKNDFKRENLLIRGAFLLPDILALTGTVSKGEQDNLRANAYASLKELNAIIANTSGSERVQDRVEIELEYKPNQVDAAGRLNHSISSDQLPYDFCFLYDFENTAKNNLQFVENYFNQVSLCTYLELFSPMADDKFSRQDNQILELVRHSGLNRYCGAGVAKLEYPYKKNIQYFALKWATESLSKDWLRIDDDFDEEYRQYELDLQNGVTREEPKLNERYVWLLDNLAEDENPKPFFRMAHRDAFVIGKKNEIEASKAEQFLKAIEDFIEDVIKKDQKLNEMQGECEIDENRLKDKGLVHSEINKVEDALISFETEMNKFVRESKNFITNQVLLQDCDSQRFSAGKEYQLNTWILKKNEPVHPVTVRYILYRIFNIIDAQLKSLNSDNNNIVKSISKYKTSYDLPDTDDVVEDVFTRLRKAERQSVFGKLYRNELKEFMDEFSEKASRQKANLVKYKEQKLKELVLGDLKKALQEMLGDWERYFKNLRSIRNNLLQSLNKLAIEEQEAGNPADRYVLATKEMKEKFWKNVRTMIKSRGVPSEVSEQIYIGQYRRFCGRRRNEYITDESAEKVENMFRKDVVEWCEKELEQIDSLKMNCIQALRREAQIIGIEDLKINTFIEEEIKKLDNLARPFVPNAPNANSIDAWGIHPDNIKELSGEQRNEWFGTELIEDSVFSSYKITRYKSNYNLKIEDFDKFSYGDPLKNIGPGIYYKAYFKRITDLTTNPTTTVTPHLDKRWHVPAFLPDLNPQKAEEEESNIHRAFLIGIIMKYTRNVNDYGSKTWELFEGNNMRLIKIGDQRTSPYSYALHNALRFNPIIVDKIMQLFQIQGDTDKEEFQDNIMEHTFCKGAREIIYLPVTGTKGTINILDLVFLYAEGSRGDESLPEKEIHLLNLLIEEIFAYFHFVFGRHKFNLAKTEAAKFIDLLKEQSTHFKNAERSERRVQNWDSILDNKVQELKKIQ